jgi:uncharacterized protein (TIGR00661 family)
MKDKNFNRPDKKPRVLIAPLDWGLGHATRCIPIILSLIEHDCEVIVAAEGAPKQLLQQEFPDLVFAELKGYRVKYSRKKFWLPAKLLMQFPKILLHIYAENRWLKKMAAQYNIDAVISDNRFGMYHAAIPSVYITHQLKIKTGNQVIEKFVQKIHYHFINKFTECWVPDWAGEINLAGDLSHPSVLPTTPVKYTDPLSRLEKTTEEIKYDCCILISGPEPQRSVFEEIIFRDLENYAGKVIVIRGLPENSLDIKIKNPLVEIKNHLPAAVLSKVLQQSNFIICRSGYSTIMDLVKLQRNATLVPTPGQTEQEYLAEYLQGKQLFYTVTQASFSLSEIIQKMKGYSFKEIAISKNEDNTVIKDFVAGLKKINNTDI